MAERNVAVVDKNGKFKLIPASDDMSEDELREAAAGSGLQLIDMGGHSVTAPEAKPDQQPTVDRMSGFYPQAATEGVKGAGKELAGMVFHGGDMIRKATGMDRVIDNPDVQELITPTNDMQRHGKSAMKMAEFVVGPSKIRAIGAVKRAMEAGPLAEAALAAATDAGGAFGAESLSTGDMEKGLDSAALAGGIGAATNLPKVVLQLWPKLPEPMKKAAIALYGNALKPKAGQVDSIEAARRLAQTGVENDITVSGYGAQKGMDQVRKNSEQVRNIIEPRKDEIVAGKAQMAETPVSNQRFGKGAGRNTEQAEGVAAAREEFMKPSVTHTDEELSRNYFPVQRDPAARVSIPRSQPQPVETDPAAAEFAGGVIADMQKQVVALKQQKMRMQKYMETSQYKEKAAEIDDQIQELSSKMKLMRQQGATAAAGPWYSSEATSVPRAEMTAPVRGPIIGPPRPAASEVLTAEQANRVKQGLYNEIGERQYSKGPNATGPKDTSAYTETQKEIAHNLMENLNRAFPEIKSLNMNSKQIMDLVPHINERVLTDAGKHDIWQAIMDHPRAISKLAIWLNRAAERGGSKEPLSQSTKRVYEFLKGAAVSSLSEDATSEVTQ